YEGSLRGTRGTLWSEAGNSTDQASLLIALLRASGVPARYASGTLDTPTAQTLILSMFPTPTHVVGHVPDGTAVADPANDPDLLTQAQAHWWVQAYINGNWVNLDPSFATAQAGDTFATASETYAELPDELRHKVTLSVKVERMEPFQFNLQDFTVTYPLTATFNSVSLVGQPILFGHFVDSDAQGGLVFTNYIHTYSPYFAVGDGDELVQGDSYQDLFTNFPLGSAYVTAVWLTVDNIAPNGEQESYTRELKDIYGPAARQPVGEVNVDVAANRGDTSQPLFSPSDFMQIHAVPHSRTPTNELDRLYGEMQEVTPQLSSAFEAANQLGEEPTNEEIALFADEHFSLILSAQALSLEILATEYQLRTTASDRAFQPESMLVRSYPDRAQLLLLSQNIVSETITSSFELLNITQQTLAYPEQAEAATFTANLLRTTHAKVVEYELMTETFSGQPDSGLLVLTEALQTGVPWVLLTPETTAGLDDLLISDEAKGRINAALANGRTVVVPQQMVEINGELTIGWLEIDALGQVQFVTEDGQYALSIGEKALIVKILVAIIAAVASIGVAIIGAVASIIVALITTFGGKGGKLKPTLATATSTTADLTLALIQTGHEAVAACHGQPGVNCDELEALLSPLALASAVVAPQAPLAGGWYGQPVGTSPANTAVNQHTIPSNLSGQAINGTLTTPLVAIENPDQLSWSATAVSPFGFDTLTAGNATLFNSGGTELGTGTASAADSQTATAVGNPLNAALNQPQGGLTFYAPATSGLSAGSQWDSYAASLNASQPHDFYFSDTTVTLNNS
ncbi:MAG: transglutaminase domain-containing protein, partial [Anaerolineales bacterium]|nr:transglutaminase domain-containing protein [Anaerolineales bacterium]